MKEKIITGIQQVGIGVHDIAETWRWYNEILGFDVKMFDDEGVAERMLPYTAGKPQPRRAILALNLRGGGGFEVWQPRGRELNYPVTPLRIGDFGINICKIKTSDINAAFAHCVEKNVNVLCEIVKSPFGFRHFYLSDPWNNIFDVEEDDYIYLKEKSKFTGGVNGVVIGVDNMERSIEFYGKLLDYDIVAADLTGVFEDMKVLVGGCDKVRRVLLKRSKPVVGPFTDLIGTSHIELVKNLDSTPVKTLNGRLWGDLGFIHLCFDIRNMKLVRECAESLGQPFVCDSGGDFDMGDANGHFTYVEDPNGTLIEFVETFKIPVVKKLGIFVNLKKRGDKKTLCRLITRALRLFAVKPEDVK